MTFKDRNGGQYISLKCVIETLVMSESLGVVLEVGTNLTMKGPNKLSTEEPLLVCLKPQVPFSALVISKHFERHIFETVLVCLWGPVCGTGKYLNANATPNYP